MSDTNDTNAPKPKDQLYLALAEFIKGQKEVQAAQKKELRVRTYRWIAFAAIFMLYFVYNGVYSVYNYYKAKSHDHVALVRLDGPVMPNANFSYGLSSRAINSAFDDTAAKAVVLVINSPGGAPAQAQMIYDLILKRKAETHKPVYAFGEDMIASAAYMVAMSADKVCAPSTALIGSIGVVMEGYDFTGVYQKWGIKDRTFTSGEHKRRNNPFEPVSEDDRAKIMETLDEVHADFIDMVKKGRGKRIDASNKELFSGDYWSGSHAERLGLLDCHDDMNSVLQQNFGTKEYIEYYPQLYYNDIMRLLQKGGQ